MIISISGRINSGKDTVGKIIQIIQQSPHYNDETVVKMLDREILSPGFEIKKFATDLKKMVAIMLNCTVEQLENQEFKGTPLGPEWDTFSFYREGTRKPLRSYANESEAQKCVAVFGGGRVVRMQMTPRTLLQLMGTECGREILHPNIWVNSLMAQYKPYNKGRSFPLENYLEGYNHKGCKFCKKDYTGYKRQDLCNDCIENPLIQFYPNWIITDTRFPNELKAIEENRGYTIKVYRATEKNKQASQVPLHVSETALDDADFQYFIINDGDLFNLVRKTRAVYELIVEEESQRNQ